MTRTYLEVTIGGFKVPSYEISASYGIDQIAADVQIRVRNRPAWLKDYMPVDIWGGSTTSNGLIARGYTIGIDREYSSSNCVNPDTLAVTNNGAYLQMPWGDSTKIYGSAASNPQTDGSIVQNIVESMGIPSSLTHILDSGTDLGTIVPVLWNTGDAGHNLIQKIDEATGYLTFCDRANVMRRIQWNGIPTTNGAYRFEEGSNLRSMRYSRSISGVFNKILVEGAQIEDTQIYAEAFASSEYVPIPPQYISTTISNDLIETVELATALAQYALNRYNRPIEQYVVTADGVADISPGMTVTIHNPSKNIYNQSFFVWHVDHRITMNESGEGDFETSMTLIGGYASDIEIEYEPPVIQLAVSSFREFIEGTGAITTVVCDASGSYDPDGTIVSYEWSVIGGTPSSATTTIPYFTFYVGSGTTTIDISLAVTDSTGEIATLTQTHTIVTSQLVAETIWAISSTKAMVSTDGGENWNEYTFGSGTGTALSRYAGYWGQLFGTSTGHLYVSQHYLGENPSDSQPHGSVQVDSVWITEQVDTKRAWAAFNDGAVYLTADAGATWEPRGTIPGSGTVYDIQEAVGGTGMLHAARGNSVYRSYDEGINWETVLTVSGSTIRQLAFGFERFFVLANGGSNHGIYDLETGTKVMSDSSLSSGVSMTVGWKTKYLLIANSNGRIGTSDFDSITLLDYTNGTPNMIVRSGNEEGVVYAASDHGIEKSVDFGATFFESMRTSDVIKQVGFGPVKEPDITGEGYIYLPNGTNFYWGTPGGNSWTAIARPTDWTTYSIPVLRVEPSTTSENTLILFGDFNNYDIRSNGTNVVGSSGGPSPLAITFDHGTTWHEVALPIPDGQSTKSGQSMRLSPVQWHSKIPGLWAIAGTHTTTGDIVKSYVWFGTTTLQGDSTYITHKYAYAKTDVGGTVMGISFGVGAELLTCDDTFATVAGWIRRDDGIFRTTIKPAISSPYGVGQNYFYAEYGASRGAYTTREGLNEVVRVPDYHNYYDKVSQLEETEVDLGGTSSDNPDIFMPLATGMFIVHGGTINRLDGITLVPILKDGQSIIDIADATYGRAGRLHIALCISTGINSGYCYVYNTETAEFSERVNAALPVSAFYLDNMTINMLKG